jgi:hypothetical protein
MKQIKTTELTGVYYAYSELSKYLNYYMPTILDQIKEVYVIEKTKLVDAYFLQAVMKTEDYNRLSKCLECIVYWKA